MNLKNQVRFNSIQFVVDCETLTTLTKRVVKLKSIHMLKLFKQIVWLISQVYFKTRVVLLSTKIVSRRRQIHDNNFL